MTTHCLIVILVLAQCMIVCCGADGPVVTLSHGGQIRGKSISYHNTPVNLFMGVRYAKPPVDSLRFKRTVEHPGWQGVMEATFPGSKCPQMEGSVSDPASMKPTGNEDCLFLDVTVPGKIQPGAKKPVMVFIHGGGYAMGSGSTYIAAQLATTGDVIVVAMNYRLALLGFLSDGPGTGNYGLWDQREALMWVKKNIAQFGGDPDMVTIFGESAGAGSVSAQTMGQHNGELFKRGIQQSGSLFMMFDKSKRLHNEQIKSLRHQTSCQNEGPVFECFKDMTSQEILQIQLMDYFTPVADEDFFAKDLSDPTYDLTSRFDLMAGVNGQEGLLFMAMNVNGLVMMNNKSLDNGLDEALLNQYLNLHCGIMAPMSPQLCVDFVTRLYDLDQAADDKDRAHRLSIFLGESFFNADTVNQLEQHSSADSDTSTYAYYYTEMIEIENLLWQVPGWLKTSADHGEEISHVFGVFGLQEDKENQDLWKTICEIDPFIGSLFEKSDMSNSRPLSTNMMKMWTNFAKSGNPNLPEPLAAGTPEWPQFNKETKQFLELNSADTRVITTPYNERLDQIRNILMPARKLQMMADRPPVEEEKQQSTQYQKQRDEL